MIAKRPAAVLDDSTIIPRLDPSGMLGAVDSASAYLLNPLTHELGSPFSRLNGRAENLVFGGMGGSASAADVIVDWLRDKLRIPAVVVRNWKLPSFVSDSTLFIAVSYSGETAETLNLYRAARSRRCPIVGIGTGGRLEELSRRNKDPFLEVQPSVAPRAALYQMVAAGALVVEELGLARSLKPEIGQAGGELKRLSRRYRISSPVRSNMAKRLALSIHDRLPAVYALERMSSIARRFKNQLNENSKMPAKYDLLPEAGHNEVEAWTFKQKGLLPIFIRSVQESPWERAMVNSFKETITNTRNIRASSMDVLVRSNSDLGRILAPIHMLDYVSVYLAYLNRVDPTPTRMIKLFRKNANP